MIKYDDSFLVIRTQYLLCGAEVYLQLMQLNALPTHRL